RLLVRGEHELAVAPLSWPPPAQATLDRLLVFPATRLFLDRAGATAAGEPTAADAAAIAEICARLDGLPLAIELAAARAAALHPAALLARLEPRLPLLTHGARDAPARQRTMRDAIAWSYDLLAPEERRLFRRLAVFAGGFSLAAAQHVWDAGDAGGDIPRDAMPSPAGGVLDLLDALASQSLVLPIRPAGEGKAASEPRFSMLETIREFAGERLAAAGEASAARLAHAEWFLDLAETSAAMAASDEPAALDRLEQEIGKLRAALRFFRERRDAERGLRLGGALQRLWWDRGYLQEGQEWLTTFLMLDRSAPPAGNDEARAHAAACGMASYLASSRGDYDVAIALAEEGLRRSRQIGDRSGV